MPGSVEASENGKLCGWLLEDSLSPLAVWFSFDTPLELPLDVLDMLVDGICVIFSARHGFERRPVALNLFFRVYLVVSNELMLSLGLVESRSTWR